MKRLLWLSMLSTLVFAAPAGAIGWEKGIRVGVDLANIGGDLGDLVGADVKTGFTVGVMSVWNVTPVVGFEAAVDYRMKGAELEEEVTDDTGNTLGRFADRLDFRYLEVPVLLRLSIPTTGPVSPSLVVGPSFAFPISAEFHPGYPGLQDQDLSDDMKTVDIGLQAGVGVGWRAGRVTPRLDVRYTHGLADIYDLDDNLETRNRALAITLGLGF